MLYQQEHGACGTYMQEHQISHKFFKAAAQEADIKLGGEGDYGIGMFFLPQETLKRTFSMRMF